MDEVLVKIEKIKKFYSLIKKNDKELLNPIINNELSKINNILNNIEDFIYLAEICEKKKNKIICYNNNNEIIIKHLFPYYWIINQMVNNDLIHK